MTEEEIVERLNDVSDKLEALELRQNLVESPVMLRIANALEDIAQSQTRVADQVAY